MLHPTSSRRNFLTFVDDRFDLSLARNCPRYVQIVGDRWTDKHIDGRVNEQVRVGLLGQRHSCFHQDQQNDREICHGHSAPVSTHRRDATTPGWIIKPWTKCTSLQGTPKAPSASYCSTASAYRSLGPVMLRVGRIHRHLATGAVTNQQKSAAVIFGAGDATGAAAARAFMTVWQPDCPVEEVVHILSRANWRSLANGCFRFPFPRKAGNTNRSHCAAVRHWSSDKRQKEIFFVVMRRVVAGSRVPVAMTTVACFFE